MGRRHRGRCVAGVEGGRCGLGLGVVAIARLRRRRLGGRRLACGRGGRVRVGGGGAAVGGVGVSERR
eukprot:scaffold116058_cov21-Phaeocystis_antarctica.AAC.1